jgi:hypothetical protein
MRKPEGTTKIKSRQDGDYFVHGFEVWVVIFCRCEAASEEVGSHLAEVPCPEPRMDSVGTETTRPWKLIPFPDGAQLSIQLLRPAPCRACGLELGGDD